MSSVITVKDMCLWYGQVQALKNININIEEKSITALIGPSGCGKSTFLKSLNRMNDLVCYNKQLFKVCSHCFQQTATQQIYNKDSKR